MRYRGFGTIVVGVAAVLFGGSARADDGTGLQVAVAADLVGSFDAGIVGSAQNRLNAREAEVLFFAPIDHLFEGQMSLAAHQEGGRWNFELHEMFLGSSKLIPRSRFRLGQFFLGVGRLNQTHRHDWPFITRPTVQRQFFGGDEGALDTGIEYSWLTPLPFYLDVTVGVTNGWVFGHSHVLGTNPRFPTHYLHLVTFQQLGNVGVQTGLNYLGRRDSAGVWTTLLGVDLTAKWRQGSLLRLLVQSEFWYRSMSNSQRAFGFYVYPQFGFTEHLSLGVRFDGYTLLYGPENFELALVPTLTYKASEFATFRAAYTYLRGDSAGSTLSNQRIFELQAVFILGAHPAHEF